MANTENWDKLKQPPKSALKQIGAGRLKGMTDIKPQWRYLIMTEVYGPCGVGWYYVVTQKWIEEGSEGQRVAFCDVDLYVKDGEEWSKPIPGNGGSMFVAKERNGPYTSDEAYKMATTDALSTAMGKIGVAADIYMGMWDGSKYREPPKANPRASDGNKQTPAMKETLASMVTDSIEQVSIESTVKALTDYCNREHEGDMNEGAVWMAKNEYPKVAECTREQRKEIIERLN